MAITNFGELRAAVIDWLDDGSLANRVNDFIAFAESRFRRDIRIREMIARATADFDTRFLSLPDDFVEMIALRLRVPADEGGGVAVLNEVSPYHMTRLRDERPGRPQHFTVHNELELDRVTGEEMTAEMVYYAALPALSEAVPTNALLKRAPDVYLYGALIEAEPFVGNSDQLRAWAEVYAAARERLHATDRRLGGPLVSRVAGMTP